MSVETEVKNGILVVRLKGEIDHHAVEKMRYHIEQQLEKTRYEGLVFSLRDIHFMDSSGLGLILGRYRTISQHGGKTVLCEVSPALRKLFEMSGLLKILPLYESEETAVNAVKAAKGA